MLLQTCTAAGLALVSAYATWVSIDSVPKLQKYEEKAQKAAEWSRAAEKRLWDTRYTVGAGLITACVSTLAALYYAVFATHTARAEPSVLGWPVILAAGAFYASAYMRSFWGSKAKIPLLEEYNEAISDSQTVIAMLVWIGAGWSTMAVLRLGSMFTTEGSSSR